MDTTQISDEGYPLDSELALWINIDPGEFWHRIL